MSHVAADKQKNVDRQTDSQIMVALINSVHAIDINIDVCVQKDPVYITRVTESKLTSGRRLENYK